MKSSIITQMAAMMEAKPIRKPTSSQIFAILAPDSDEFSSEICAQTKEVSHLLSPMISVCYMFSLHCVHHAEANGAEDADEDVSCGNLVLAVDGHGID